LREVQMATAADATHIAMGLVGTISAAHFDRTAFRVKRAIYATVGGAPRGR